MANNTKQVKEVRACVQRLKEHVTEGKYLRISYFDEMVQKYLDKSVRKKLMQTMDLVESKDYVKAIRDFYLPDKEYKQFRRLALIDLFPTEIEIENVPKDVKGLPIYFENLHIKKDGSDSAVL